MHSHSLISPPRLYQFSIIAMIVLHFLLPLYQLIVWPFSTIGIVLFFGGTALAVWAKKIFKKNNTPIKPYDNPAHLHTDGPFSFSRNPMYLGITIGLFGIAIFLGSAVTFIFPVLFFIIMNLKFIPHEEKALRETLPEFDAYTKRVRRWL